MENILQNPGFQHIIEKSLQCLDKKSIAEFRLVNRYCKEIADTPRVYLKKFSNENVFKDLITKWELLTQKIPNEGIKHTLAFELSKMYGKRCVKLPLELAYEISTGTMNAEDTELATFIIENSDPNEHVLVKLESHQNIWPSWFMQNFGMVVFDLQVCSICTVFDLF